MIRSVQTLCLAALGLALGAAATLPARAELAVITAAEKACLQAAAPVAEVGQAVQRHHALAMHGTPKYGPDFRQFDYVNPDAPKGGTLRLATEGSFDSFNPFNSKGDPANPGVYETLMKSSDDEAFTEYGLIAESVEMPADRSWVTFHLRPEARWHDGAPITAEDVAFSFEILKKDGAPFYRYYYGSVASVEILGSRTVKFQFGTNSNQELPLILGQLPILPKHWWEGRDFAATHLDPPLGSGPYRVGAFEPGRFLEQIRVDDYWGRDLAVRRGTGNFDRIRIDYYRDRIAIREAVKGGGVDYFLENQAKAWAVDWETPAVRDGELIKALIPQKTPQGMQAFVMNARRARFQDARVRQAIGLAFDFEWTNRNLFYEQYTRSYSYFSNSELAAVGSADGEERAILSCLKAYFPDDILAPPAKPAVTDGSGWPRDNLREAFALLEAAGWVVRDLKLVEADTGRPFRFEILLVSPAFERIVLPFKRNLERLGMEVSVRLVDQSQYINRIRQYDFDVIITGWGQSESPGNEQRDYWGSAAAGRPGTRNYIGISNPGIDALIEVLIEAPDRASLIARTRALDRALLAGRWVVPNWHLAAERIVYWDKFGMPELTPYKGVSVDTWWFDPAKAERLSRGGAS
mgnify:CR=1 FL=1